MEPGLGAVGAGMSLGWQLVLRGGENWGLFGQKTPEVAVLDGESPSHPPVPSGLCSELGEHAWSPAPVLSWGVVTAVLSGLHPLLDRGPQAGELLRHHGRTQDPGRGRETPAGAPSLSRVSGLLASLDASGGSQLHPCDVMAGTACNAISFSRLCFLLFRRPLGRQDDNVLFLSKGSFFFLLL